MFYDTRSSQLLNVCPLNGYTEEGVLVQGLDLTDAETQKRCGILPVVSDTPAQPVNTYEDISQRLITITDNSVSVVRTWLPNQQIIPETISARQIRLWLVDHNISLSNVINTINTIEDVSLREKTLIEWEFAPYVERTHPLLDTLGQALGLSSQQINQAFIEASML